LRTLRLRLREGQVALRAIGSAVPRASSAQIDEPRVSLIARTAAGAFVPGARVSEGATLGARDGVGFSVEVSGVNVNPGQTVSFRLAIDGLPDANYRVDLFWPSLGDTLSAELISPYGRAGFPLARGGYELTVYLDGQTRASVAFTVE
jgi:hypothetical protein